MKRSVAVALLLGAVIGVGAAWFVTRDDGPQFEAVPWQSWERVDAHTVRLQYGSYHSESCYQPAPKVAYGETAVAIELRFKRISEWCTLEGRIGPPTIDVALDEDLGDRMVVDSAHP